jgi:hypothetical protein
MSGRHHQKNNSHIQRGGTGGGIAAGGETAGREVACFQNSGRVIPWTSPEYAQRYKEDYDSIPKKKWDNFEYMPEPVRQQAETNMKNYALSMHLQFQMENHPQVGWQGTWDKTLQKAQDRGVLEWGSYAAQAADNLRLETNNARHKSLGKSGQHHSIQGQGPLPMRLGTGDPWASGPAGAAESRRPPSSRITYEEY